MKNEQTYPKSVHCVVTCWLHSLPSSRWNILVFWIHAAHCSRCPPYDAPVLLVLCPWWAPGGSGRLGRPWERRSACSIRRWKSTVGVQSRQVCAGRSSLLRSEQGETLRPASSLIALITQHWFRARGVSWNRSNFSFFLASRDSTIQLKT